MAQSSSDVTVGPDTEKLGPFAYALASALGTEPTSTRKGIKELLTHALAALRAQTEEGQGIAEYLLILALIAVVTISALNAFGVINF